MLNLIAAAALSSVAAPAAGQVLHVPTAAAVQASGTVTIRLLTAAVIDFDAASPLSAQKRSTTVTMADGEHEARYVEFQ